MSVSEGRAGPTGSGARYVAIITDGNGRWARAHGVPINESDVGLNPSNDGNLVRLVVPELTEERRRDLVKVVRHLAEEGRVAIRNVRRDVMHDLRELKVEGDLSSDDEHRAEVELQKLTDARIGDLDGVLKAKEEEILAV